MLDRAQHLVSVLAAAAIAGVAITLAFLAPTASAQTSVKAPPLEPNLGWINTDHPLALDKGLRGQIVVLDFWTYCCINCMQVLPELEKIEHRYADEPVIVVGVHSAKHDREGDPDAVRNAVLRYDIKHPVVVDDDFGIWRRYGVHAWPTMVIIDPEGNAVWARSGENKAETIAAVIDTLLKEHRDKGTLADGPIEWETESLGDIDGPLRFPGKVLAVPPEGEFDGRVFVSDGGNDRIIEAAWPDEDGSSRVIAVYGDGQRGAQDGPAKSARFNHPQGMTFDRASNTLYVADTRNHTIRAIDLKARTVRTIAGTGEQVYDRNAGGRGIKQGLASPWALALSPDRETLYIAMAGPHQLWAMDLDSTKLRVIAGTGREAITDGDAFAGALAQPSGLALAPDGRSLYFTDTEGSAVRVLDLETEQLRTIIGDPNGPAGGLFSFGDKDGAFPIARLQHAIGIALDAGGKDRAARLFIADTYNDKLKVVDPTARSVVTFALPPADGNEIDLEEPTGVSFAPETDRTPARLFLADTNNHRVLIINPADGSSRELMLVGEGL